MDQPARGSSCQSAEKQRKRENSFSADPSRVPAPPPLSSGPPPAACKSLREQAACSKFLMLRLPFAPSPWCAPPPPPLPPFPRNPVLPCPRVFLGKTFLLLRPSQVLSPLINDIDGQRKHNRCVLLDTYLRQCLQVTKLNRGGLRLQNFRGVCKFLGSFKLALGVNNLRPALALGFGLLRDGALHLLGDVHLFDLDFGNLDAPGFRVRVENDLELGVDLVALREYFIEFELSDDAADGGLRELRSCIGVILHLGERQVGVHHAEVAYRIDLHRNVVARNNVLRRNVERFDSHVDAVERFNRPEHQPEAGILSLGNQAAKSQHHAAFPFLDDVNRIPKPDERESDDQCDPDKTNFHVFPPKRDNSYFVAGAATPAGSTYSFSPSTRKTFTVSPSCTGSEDSARPSSPCTRLMPSAPEANAAIATPCAPISSSFPVAVFHFLETNTISINNTTSTPNR